MPARKNAVQKGKKLSHDSLKDGIEKLLESMSPEKRVERIKDIITDYVATFEDESVLTWLKILLNEYETQSLNKEAWLICFRVYLRELYWKLPRMGLFYISYSQPKPTIPKYHPNSHRKELLPAPAGS